MDTPGAVGGVRSAREMKKSPRKQDKKTAADSSAAKTTRTRVSEIKNAGANSEKKEPPSSGSTPLAARSSPKPSLSEEAKKTPLEPLLHPSAKTTTQTQAKTAERSVPTKKPKRRTTPPVSGKDFKVPSILLEGDQSSAPPVSGPGLRYALAPQPVAGAPSRRDIGELPEAYGTGKIFLAARDPHWLYASWDFTQDQQKELNARSREGHLILRILAEGEKRPAVPEVHVHPESRNWFVNVPRAETRYSAEIGFYEKNGAWRSVSVSQGTFTPPEAPSEDLSAEFATIPPQVTFRQVLEAVEQFVARKEGQPLLEVVAEAQKQEGSEQQELPRRAISIVAERPSKPVPSRKRTHIPVRIEPGHPWKQEQQAALKRLIHIDELRRVFLGSIEITELVRRQLEVEELASIAAQENRGVPVALRIEKIPGVGISSPLGGEMKVRGRKFWFKVNAELIVYGATEPDARVTVADRQIQLRPDGTFSFRFSLPDGRYQLPAVAVSGDGEEAREARLEFARSTEYQGPVEAHPQDATLRPPRGEHVQ